MMSRRSVFMLVGFGLLVMVLGLIPISAQEGDFATNTPAARQASFATNTPDSNPTIQSAPLLLATNTPQAALMNPAPDAPGERYALRRWDDAGLTLTWIEQVQRLTADDLDSIVGLQLFQKEIERRYPATPRNPVLREQLLKAMLAAPPDTVDIRPVIRPYVEAALNSLKPDFSLPGEVTVGDFNLSITPANLDGRSGKGATIYMSYAPDNNQPAYRDVALALIDGQGVYRVPQPQPPYPVVGMDAMGSAIVGDWNGDFVDELMLTVLQPGSINGELYIYGWRGGAVINLVEPGKRALYLGVPISLSDATGFTLSEYREEVAAWQCFGERSVTWRWTNNFFRPQPAEDFAPRNSLGCALAAAEPLFELPPDEAMKTIDEAMRQATPDDTYAAGRAAMMKVMLHVLNGEADIALREIDQLSSGAQAGTWLAEQVAAFQQIAAQPNVTPVQVCAALETASPFGACEVNSVLARLFTEFPLNREETVEQQTARLGLRVGDTTTIKQVGKLDRQAIRFLESGEQWWAFAPLNKDNYTAERIDTPPGYEPAPAAPPDVLTAPETAYDALLLRNNPEEVLNILDNMTRTNAGLPLGSAARFLQALSYDLLGDRPKAQRGYYTLWSDDPASVWGQLAAAHLERR
jgi:hypothetical protein